jgi:Rad3-related DNA helicase
MSSKWYARQAMVAILQGCGRVVRSEDDWGFTYILDSNFGFLYKQMKNRVPVWWKDALDIQG